MKRKKKQKDYIGKYPVNSRITIDYSKKKPEVKFEYPEKKSSQINWTIPVIAPAFILAMITAFIFGSFIFDMNKEGSLPLLDDCTTYHQHMEGSNKLLSIKVVCFIDGKEEIMIAKVRPATGFPFKKALYLYPSTLKDSYKDILNGSASMVFILFLLFIYAKLLKFVYFKTRWGNKTYPEIMKATANSHFSTSFTKVPKEKKIEIPLFKNIYLDYKATKEFSKYLTRMEIREHEFDKVVKKWGKLKRKKGQIFLWKATFYFSEIPKDGNLEVWWT